MRFMDVVRRDLILVDMKAEDKQGVFFEFAEALERGGVIEDRLAFYKLLLRREEFGSTGIGLGVAAPHTLTPTVDRVWLVIGTSREGIDWDAIDGRPVYLMFLIITPSDRCGDHLRTLELISRNLRNEFLRRCLLESKTADDVWQLLEEADADPCGS